MAHDRTEARTRSREPGGRRTLAHRLPAGRPKGSRNRDTLAREAGLASAVAGAAPYVAAAWAAVGEVLADPEARQADKLRAGGIVLDRAYGRPVRVDGRTYRDAAHYGLVASRTAREDGVP